MRRVFAQINDHRLSRHEACAIFSAEDDASALARLRRLIKSTQVRSGRDALKRKRPWSTVEPVELETQRSQLIAKISIPWMEEKPAGAPEVTRAKRLRAMRDILKASGALATGERVRYELFLAISDHFEVLIVRIDSSPQRPHFELDEPMQMALAEIAEIHCRCEGGSKSHNVETSITGQNSATLRAKAMFDAGEARERVARLMDEVGRADIAKLLRRTR